VVIDAQVRDGSLREAVSDLGIPMLLYEAGEALRFDEVAIRAGLRGILRVMAELGMVTSTSGARTRVEPVVVKRSRWVRAPSSGVLRNRVQLGDVVSRRQLLGHLADPTGEDEVTIEAPCAGVLIGRTEIPLLNEGDAAYHIATFDDSVDAEESVMHLQNELDPMGRPGPAGEPPIS
jgi:hypothetical protein